MEVTPTPIPVFESSDIVNISMSALTENTLLVLAGVASIILTVVAIKLCIDFFAQILGYEKN